MDSHYNAALSVYIFAGLSTFVFLQDHSESDLDLFPEYPSSSSDVPIQAFKDMEEKLKEKTCKLRSKEQEMQAKLNAMQKQLEAKDHELQQRREKESRLEGEYLRLAVKSQAMVSYVFRLISSIFCFSSLH